MFLAMYWGRYLERMQEMPFSLMDSVMPSSVPSMSQPCVSTMPNLPLAAAEPGFSPEMTAAAQPSAKMAWRMASLTLSSKVVWTEEISTQTMSAILPGWDMAKSFATRKPFIAAAQPMKPMRERSTPRQRPSVLMSSASRPGPRKPVEDTTTSLPICSTSMPASAMASLQTLVTRGTDFSRNMSRRFSTGILNIRSLSKKFSSPSSFCSGVKSGTAIKR
mmetsp:Transcript_9980/g.32576  ORF Transcript_9980/g.32576 Transcript_9980/m.32576 type:complete len:219 (-) Transcript_9980:326-982(-)